MTKYTITFGDHDICVCDDMKACLSRCIRDLAWEKDSVTQDIRRNKKTDPEFAQQLEDLLIALKISENLCKSVLVKIEESENR